MRILVRNIWLIWKNISSSDVHIILPQIYFLRNSGARMENQMIFPGPKLLSIYIDWKSILNVRRINKQIKNESLPKKISGAFVELVVAPLIPNTIDRYVKRIRIRVSRKLPLGWITCRRIGILTYSSQETSWIQRYMKVNNLPIIFFHLSTNNNNQ